MKIRDVLLRMGVSTTDLEDDEVLDMSQRALEQYGTVTPSASELLAIKAEIVYERKCCTPEVFAGPSGLRRRHVRTCPRTPGQPIAEPEPTTVRVRPKVVPIRKNKGGRIHPACVAALVEGIEPCPDCRYRSCVNDDCTHEVCVRERGWLEYFG